MEKPKFQNVSLDSYTHELLTELAEEAKLTRAAYLRSLIRNIAAKHRKGSALLVADVSIPDEEMVVRHGVTMAMSDLNLLQQVATRVANRLGVTIDTRKWIAELLAQPDNGEELA